jgi:sugar/nucleoside kinase (ribokinase family)
LLGADAVWCGNWATMPNQSDALRAISALDVDPAAFVFDPGPMTGASDRRIEELLDALGRLAGNVPVVVSVNGEEANRLASAVGSDADRPGRLRDVRADTGAAVVEHEVDAALAATGAGVVRVPNLSTETVVSDTGGGDRFGAGLALARAAGWDWPLALALGNACASYYVGAGESGDATALRGHVADRTPVQRE